MKRFFSKLLYVVFGLPLVLSSLMLLSVRPWALDRDFYKRFVTDEKLYAVLASPTLVAEAEEHITIGDTVFDGPALVGAIQKRIPEAELKTLGTQAVDRTLDLVEGKAKGGIELDLRPLKAALRKNAPGVAADYVKALPESKEAPKPGDLSARPASLPLPAAEKAASAALVKAAEEMPDVYSNPNFRLEIDSNGLIGQAALDRATLTMSALAAILIAGLATMGGGGLAAILGRAGAMIGGPSVLALVVGAVLALPGANFLEKLVPPEAQAVFAAGGAGAAMRSYMATVLGEVAKSFFLTGVIGASLGGLLGSTKRFIEPKEIE